MGAMMKITGRNAAVIAQMAARETRTTSGK
jgi:hypothetical protein